MTVFLHRKFYNFLVNNYLAINMMDDGVEIYRAKFAS